MTCRRSVIPLSVLSDKEAPGVQMVFEYSGLARTREDSYVTVIVMCGGVIAVSWDWVG